MATETETRVVDDLDRTLTAEVRVVLGWASEGDEDTVILDLTKEHAAGLHELIKSYLEAGTQVVGTPLLNLRAAQRRPERHYDATAVREWAAAKGITIKARGRINERLIDQYLAEQAEIRASAPAQAAEEATDGPGARDGTTVPPEVVEEPSAPPEHEVIIRNAGAEADLDEDDEDDDVEQEQPEPEPPVAQAPKTRAARAGKSTTTRGRTRKSTKAVAAKSPRAAKTTSKAAKS